jgi:hypothetical protein
MKRPLLLAIGVLLPVLTISNVKGDGDQLAVRWDIVHISDFSGPVVNAGGRLLRGRKTIPRSRSPVPEPLGPAATK